jgi:ribosomal protein S18 acetylase RimI-like enzyme
MFFRPVTEKDADFIKKMVDETWEFNAYSDNTLITNLILSDYLKSLFNKSNYSDIAVYNDQPVGFLFGRCDTISGENLKTLLPFENHNTETIDDTGWNIYLRDLKKIKDADDFLIKDKKDLFDGELILFIIDGHHRKSGIGRTLLERFMKHLRENNVKRAYLFTDDYCNFEFYDKIGFHKENVTSINLSDSNDRKFFLYSFDNDTNTKSVKRN